MLLEVRTPKKARSSGRLFGPTIRPMSHSHNHSRANAHIPDVAEVIGSVPALRFDALLRQRREMVGLEQREAVVLSSVDPDELSGIEAGRRRPGAETVARLVDTYGCSVQDFVPPRHPIDPTRFDGLSEADVLKHYLEMVRAWRETERPQCFRADDLRTLVGILGTDGAGIEAKLRALTSCSSKTAKWFRRLFVLGLAATSGALLYQGTAAAGDSAGQYQMAPAVNAGSAAHSSASRPAVVCHALSVTPAPVPAGSSAPVPAGSSAPVPAPSSGPAAVAKVSVAVMAYADVQLDSAGTSVAVRTNTGNPPDCAASWYVFGPQHASGDALENTAVINRVMDAVAGTATLPAPGQWAPGTWYGV
jgi:transcriptional regulator with XRE-family HTH domain